MINKKATGVKETKKRHFSVSRVVDTSFNQKQYENKKQ
jgi:hypothetical protein